MSLKSCRYESRFVVKRLKDKKADRDAEETTEATEAVQEKLPGDFVFNARTCFQVIATGNSTVTPTGLSLQCNTICSDETPALNGEPMLFEIIDPDGNLVYSHDFEFQTDLNFVVSLYPSNCGLEEFSVGTYTDRSSFVNYDYESTCSWEVVAAEE